MTKLSVTAAEMAAYPVESDPLLDAIAKAAVAHGKERVLGESPGLWFGAPRLVNVTTPEYDGYKFAWISEPR